jgi:hypothetical protein
MVLVIMVPGNVTVEKIQSEVAGHVAWLRKLLDRLVSVPLMGDWEP